MGVNFLLYTEILSSVRFNTALLFLAVLVQLEVGKEPGEYVRVERRCLLLMIVMHYHVTTSVGWGVGPEQLGFIQIVGHRVRELLLLLLDLLLLLVLLLLLILLLLLDELLLRRVLLPLRAIVLGHDRVNLDLRVLVLGLGEFAESTTRHQLGIVVFRGG